MVQSKDHPRLCPICAAEFKKDHGLYCEYACGSRYNYETVAMVFGTQQCTDNQLVNPATEFLFHGEWEDVVRKHQEHV